MAVDVADHVFDPAGGHKVNGRLPRVNGGGKLRVHRVDQLVDPLAITLGPRRQRGGVRSGPNASTNQVGGVLGTVGTAGTGELTDDRVAPRGITSPLLLLCRRGVLHAPVYLGQLPGQPLSQRGDGGVETGHLIGESGRGLGNGRVDDGGDPPLSISRLTISPVNENPGVFCRRIQVDA